MKMMKEMAFPLLAAFSLSLLAVPVGWAAQQQREPESQQAPQLYQKCREQLQKEPNNKEAKQLCDEGMKLHRQGKDEEAVKTIQEGLAKFKQ